MLLMVVKVTFDHISRNSITGTLQSMGADGDLRRWTELFMSDKSIELVIDSYQCTEV